MTDDSNKIVVVRHHIVREVRTVPKQKAENPDDDKWCWTRISEARERNAKDTKKCMSEVLQILLESCGVLALFIFENLIGIVFLTLGIFYLKSCPYRDSIPISLIVIGVSSLVHGITILIIRWKYVNLENKKDGFATCAQAILLITSLVHLVALFWAVFNVFGIRDDVETKDENSPKYCHPFLYWFVFWFFIFMAILGLLLLILLVCLCCFILSGAATPSPDVIVLHQQSSGPQSNVSNQSMTGQQPDAVSQPSTVPSTA